MHVLNNQNQGKLHNNKKKILNISENPMTKNFNSYIFARFMAL